MEIRLDDVTDPRVIMLLEEHLRDMRADSPPESTHALDCTALQAADVSFWTLWQQDQVAGCIALKMLSPDHGEIKSMRVAPAFRRQGLARALLAHLIAEARRQGLVRLSLETGTPPAFEPSHRLYETCGFRDCAPFADYRADPYSRYMTLLLE
ncbi:GNAT family N-acetyltransferase [Pseudaeromonas sharmana]|uniref:GNAT family N-acetyltransferase n=1 Tax=Pseudaeromonas sharmana TaxID=328412 RepID=A0ABV8CR86_9GAMM